MNIMTKNCKGYLNSQLLAAMFQCFRVNVGLFCSTPAVAVGRAVPQKVAMEMLFTGLPITAQGIQIRLLFSEGKTDIHFE